MRLTTDAPTATAAAGSVSAHRWLVALAAVAMLLALLPAPLRAQPSARPLVVDTDLGADDVMALAWLVNQPSIEILAITVTGTGLTTCAAGVANLRSLLVALDAVGPEVGCGSEIPLGGGTPFPADRRAAADALSGLGLPPAPDASAPARSAEEIIGALLDATADPLAILSLGPMTTLGRVLADPDRAVRVASVTAMLGALEVPGNVVPDGATVPGAAEWNAHADPAAVAAVLESGAPVTIVPLDATNQVPLSQTLLDGLAAGGEDPSAAITAALLATNPWMAEPGWYPWDPLAAVALGEPGIIETRERLVDVVQDGPEAGALRASPEGLRVQAALGVDRNAFELALLDGIRGGSDGPDGPTGVVTITSSTTTCTLDPNATSTPGLAIVQVEALDAPAVVVLAGLGEGYGITDLEALLATASGSVQPPDWLLLAVYAEVEAGSTLEETAELTPGDYAAFCATGDDAGTRYLVAPTLLTITE